MSCDCHVTFTHPQEVSDHECKYGNSFVVIGTSNRAGYVTRHCDMQRTQQHNGHVDRVASTGLQHKLPPTHPPHLTLTSHTLPPHLTPLTPLLSFHHFSHHSPCPCPSPSSPIAMKQAANSPAFSFHTSRVKRKVAMAVRPEKVGARNTHTSRMCVVMLRPLRM